MHFTGTAIFIPLSEVIMELLNYPNVYRRDRGNLPHLPIVNMFAEASEPEENVILQSRPGLQILSSLGEEPVRKLYSEKGVFNGALFAIAGEIVYRDGAQIGTLDGSYPVSIDSFADLTFLTAGAKIWAYDGVTYSAVPFPDDKETLRLCVGASRLIVIEKNTQRIYWSDPLSQTIDPLSFAEAENSPDALLDLLYIGDTLILFGESTTEFWTSSTDADLPFVPVQGRVFPKGVRGPGCATKINSTYAWITDTNQVCLTAPDNVVSSRELELIIQGSSTASLWTFYIDSVEFLAVTTDQETWVFNTLTGYWSTFESYGETNFEPVTWAKNTFGSQYSGRLLSWQATFSDESRDILERRFRVFQSIKTDPVIIYNIVLKTDSGTTNYLTGIYSNPRVELRTSRDGGNTFSPWRVSNLGVQGAYRQQAKWLSLGMFSYPGAMAELRITDPVPFTVSSTAANEPYGGY